MSDLITDIRYTLSAGVYTLNHDFDNLQPETGNVRSSRSSRSSVKSACDEEERELKVKLMENYVNDSSKQKYNARSSLKRIFSKKKKKKTEQ